MASTDDITDAELVQRVVYALLRPAVRVAGMFGVPLKTVQSLVEAALFQELRARGMTLDEAGEALGVGRRTAARLSKKLKERFVVPELRHNLPRRIEFMVGVRPLSAARIRQALPEHRAADVDEAIAALRSEGRIDLVPGRTPRFRPAEGLRRLSRDTWRARVGGLTSFAENLADAVYGRFFASEPGAFARTLSFNVPEGGHEALERLYSETLVETIERLNREAEETEQGAPMQLSLCWAPYELIRNTWEAGRDEDDLG